jgi:hypothetical protein
MRAGRAGGLGSSLCRPGDVHGASHGGVGAVCPRGAHIVGSGATVAGKETGLTGEAHGSARGDMRTDGSAPTRRTHRAKREGGGSAFERLIADRAGPPDRGRVRARAHGAGWASWADKRGGGAPG